MEQSPEAIARRASQAKQAMAPAGDSAPIELADESRHFDHQNRDALLGCPGFDLNEKAVFSDSHPYLFML